MSSKEKYLLSPNKHSHRHQEIKHEFERISLAYREFNDFPKKLAIYLGKNIKFLDLSYNNLQNLSFLTNFPVLHTLVLDRNPRLNINTLPYLPKLQILWLNNCNIVNTSEWIFQLKFKCPKINQLSMMCNPVGSTCLNGIREDEEKKYHKEIAKLLPTLKYFDGISIMSIERKSKIWINTLQIKYTLRKKWKSLWDFQNIKNYEIQEETIQNIETTSLQKFK